jgi:hypothetical protein
MSLASAKKNLWRALFFLQHAQREQRHHSLRFDEFAAYLSAFLACARYFTDMLERAKRKGRPGWSRWWCGYKDGLSPEDRELLNFMTQQRDLEQHEEGARAEPGVAFVSVLEMPLDSDRNPYRGLSSPRRRQAPRLPRSAGWFTSGSGAAFATTSSRTAAATSRYSNRRSPRSSHRTRSSW